MGARGRERGNEAGARVREEARGWGARARGGHEAGARVREEEHRGRRVDYERKCGSQRFTPLVASGMQHVIILYILKHL